TECPVALAYEVDLARQAGALAAKGVAVVAVSANGTETRDRIAAHRTEVKLPYPIYQDVDGALRTALGATRTSEVVLLDKKGQVAYQGRIDDRVSPAVARPKRTTHELDDAIAAVLAGKKVAVARTQAAGCYIARRPTAKVKSDVTYAADVAPI